MSTFIAVIVAVLLVGGLAWAIAVLLVANLASSDRPQTIEAEAREANARIFEAVRQTQSEMLRVLLEQRRIEPPR